MNRNYANSAVIGHFHILFQSFKSFKTIFTLLNSLMALQLFLSDVKIEIWQLPISLNSFSMKYD